MDHAPRCLRPFARLLLVALLPYGCTSQYIPNTDVEDTPENRTIVEFCERYRKAVELKDISTLLDLASPKYYEDGGNVDASDDIDYSQLKQYLSAKYKDVAFADASGIRHEIRYRRVTVEDEVVYVDYTYSASYRFLRPDGTERWQNAVEENRLELVPEGESYRIIAGM